MDSSVPAKKENMSKTSREVFLRTILANLRPLYPQWQIEDHCKIEWAGQPSNIWPEADIIIDIPGRRFIIDYDEDNDPGRNLIKYWPILHEQDNISLTIIQVWKRGKSTDDDVPLLTRWMGARLMKLYPGNIYELIERTYEPAEVITKKISQIILGREPFSGN